jgi:hypothetical protein
MAMMKVEIDGARDRFSPGERVEGLASWELEEAPDSLEVRLFWSTSGRGDEDQDVVEVQPVQAPAASGWSRFAFDLPAGPYSFSGQLITLAWAIELVAPRERMAASALLVVAPGGQEVRIDGEPAPPPPPTGGAN